MERLRRILVVDGSRVVRATLAKHLKDDFEIFEEHDGVSAWQTLMLDASIAAVVSGIHPPKLEAHDLLARLRASSMRRLREVPFVLIVSDLDNRAERQYDQTCGVTGFITKTMDKTTIVGILNKIFDPTAADPIAADPADRAAVDLSSTDILPEHAAVTEEAPPTAPADTPVEPLSKGPKLVPHDAFVSLASSISFSNSHSNTACALVFGIDNREALIQSFGQDVVEIIIARIASLLFAKVGPLDSIGRRGNDRLAIISSSVDLEKGIRFGHRVCRSLASGQVTIRGHKMKLTASVGVASSAEDHVADGTKLLEVADKRLDQALLCGGNTVASEHKPDCPLHCKNKMALKLIEALSSQGDKNIAKNIGTLGLKVLPLLKIMDRELSLGLPLADIKHQLQQRAKTEEASA